MSRYLALDDGEANEKDVRKMGGTIGTIIRERNSSPDHPMFPFLNNSFCGLRFTIYYSGRIRNHPCPANASINSGVVRKGNSGFKS